MGMRRDRHVCNTTGEAMVLRVDDGFTIRWGRVEKRDCGVSIDLRWRKLEKLDLTSSAAGIGFKESCIPQSSLDFVTARSK